MKPFVHNKGLGLLELHQSTESKIRKSLTRPWWRFWLIFDLISRYIFFKSTSQENRKKNWIMIMIFRSHGKYLQFLTHSYGIVFWQIFSSKNREGIQPSMLVKKNSGQYGAVKDVKKNSESNVDKQNLFGFPLMQKSEWLSHFDSHFWSHRKFLM